MIRDGDNEGLRKERGAFFTPSAIADFLADWAVLDQADAKVMDPTCGEAVFLLAAGRRLKALGRDVSDLDEQLFGFDLHDTSLEWADKLLDDEGLDAHLQQGDFFAVPTPDQLGSPVPEMDAIIGNPPFVRYQRHIGEARDRSKQAALRQGVRLSNLASSWAALLIHACGFLKPTGRLAMVLPAELLTVGYAEPVREWLKNRFEQVHLVMFDKLQFQGATEKVVLVLAAGDGGCDAFSLYYLNDGEDLAHVRPMSNHAAPVSDSGKWTDLLLPNRQRHLFRQVSSNLFTPLKTYGAPELGTVTGSNAFFALTETTRREFGLSEAAGQVIKICPPGTKHLTGLRFSTSAWAKLRDSGERVWLFRPDANDVSPSVTAYIHRGFKLGVNQAYKCTIRHPWWRPPAVPAPDLFFTYMSHRYPRLITNSAGTTFLNSMHGLRLKDDVPDAARNALPLLAFNSVTMLGAEIFGRSYGGGILKMEPREAASLPVPPAGALSAAWDLLGGKVRSIERSLQNGHWANVVTKIDQALLVETLGLSPGDVSSLQQAAQTLRTRRMGARA
ncbi:HsdM family class I SAM-dependent methyltransferase [Jiangella alkaliphila]|uniref:N-6 DNA Methylase n=1 Tax=Jiangella alkaliphila TaxID=419479 RepID=A0A1H2KP39_9ACTN|nr:N-6 DNA methylase [Jiangella alkaliphila]SDU70423.1 N-6 DNA Methylase [Jiangella alkaliphila]